ncbi:unnamed protein product [Notodromas monacha]|uniref:Xyloside xylosyltransferase 1 n=1 Tax=Notodromas monacha TaxID=399045 RepID=A0A7R9BI12_9CRUS|nr:unnamed protein product [Notodromas monacha]CAG0914276.1 unnamed protein product [Notodromas monacha]
MLGVKSRVSATQRVRRMSLGLIVIILILIAAWSHSTHDSCSSDEPSCNAEIAKPWAVEPVVIGFLFCRVDTHTSLKAKLRVMLESLLQKASVVVRFHVFVCEDGGYEAAVGVITAVSDKLGIAVPEISRQPVRSLFGSNLEQARSLQQMLARPGTYYHDELFVVAPFLHNVQGVTRLIMLDVDLKFVADIADLHAEFRNFSEKSVMALAPELSPVYYHILYNYRKKHPDSKFGSTSPKQMQGVNSGVILVDVEKMRESEEYRWVMEPANVSRLLDTYEVRNRTHLGDQDLLALMSFEHPELIHFLDCGWNRVLCEFWRSVYPKIFDEYFYCDKSVKIYHGNCGSTIPD